MHPTNVVKSPIRTCFWALLSANDLRFYYLCPAFVSLFATDALPLIGRSFFDFVHPEESCYARADLTNFLNTRSLFGSVTRCRYRNLSQLSDGKATKQKEEEYIVLDVVMNVVSDHVVLAFFHLEVPEITKPPVENKIEICGEAIFNQEDIQSILDSLERTVTEKDRKHRPFSVDPEGTFFVTSPMRIFQILDTKSGELLLTWPGANLGPVADNPLPFPGSQTIGVDCRPDDLARLAKELSSPSSFARNRLTDLSFGPNTGRAACMKRYTAKQALTYAHGVTRLIEGVVIPYGSLTFVSFEIIPTTVLSPTEPLAMLNKLSAVAVAMNHASAAAAAAAAAGGSLPSPTVGHQKIGAAAAPVGHGSPQLMPGGVIDPKQNLTFVYAPPPNYEERRNSPPGDRSQPLIPYARRVSPASPTHPQYPPPPPYIEGGATAATGPAQTQVYADAMYRAAVFRKVCESCGTSNSPEWRKGPTGHKTLCNACGLRYSRSIARGKTKASRPSKLEGLQTRFHPYPEPTISRGSTPPISTPPTTASLTMAPTPPTSAETGEDAPLAMRSGAGSGPMVAGGQMSIALKLDGERSTSNL
ncbi:uncharacterized protein VTP21DRAFT_5691 [Calcarisporiella thermophila]|uniref:uncharacterized protein n=1 Tax=Calcarisporiella thermophila TaxID=911321 RepID=UPI0037433379